MSLETATRAELGPEQEAPRGPHAHFTVDQIQARYSELSTAISNAVEEQHQLCDELMTRLDIVADQSKVDWFVVAEAVRDACDEELGGPKDYERQFKKAGLLVTHQEDLAITATSNK